jgi:hypothetical protein
MEEVELALPEDFGQVCEEVGQDLLHAARMLRPLSVDQLVNVLRGAEGIAPDSHLQGDP